MKQLDVFKGDVLIGYLRQQSTGQLEFNYESEWLARPGAAALSDELPLNAQTHKGAAVVNYFDNLLPEGGVRQFVAQAAQVSPNNVFGLMERFGGDTAGALSLLPQGQRPSGEPRYMAMTAESIRKWFQSSHGLPFHLADNGPRMSLSGAQDKMAVFIDATGTIKIPLGDAPSSHIIKPSMGDRSHIPQTAVNETLVMGLASAVGLNVPASHYDPALSAFIIERYDRERVDGRLQRLHQNDLCQILGVGPGLKYESEGGPTLAACCDAVMRHSSQPAMDKKRLLEWVAFNVGVGNMDSHAKNLSLLTKNGRTQLAPFYDLVSTTVYEHLSRRFAFKIGGENRPGWMMERHWDRCAGELQVKPQLLRQIRKDMQARIMQELPKVADALRGQLTAPESLSMVDRVQTEVRRCAGRLVRDLPTPTQAVDKRTLEGKPALAGLRDRQSYKAALNPAASAWSADQERRAAGLEGIKAAATGALLTFAEIGAEAISKAGGASKVDWQQVEDAAIAKSLQNDQQPADDVYRAISGASPGALTEAQQAALRERIASAARNIERLDRGRDFSM